MPKSKENVLPIIWGALLVSQLIYLVIPQFLEITAEPPEQIIIFALCGIGMSNAVFSFVVPNFLKNQDRISLSIIQYALFESCAIFGFICAFLGAESMYHYGLAFLGAGGMLLVFPKQEIKGRVQ
ncbi:MAG: hypothetical protein CL916_08700 [Deltaproteobacteria bacterium]|nr:hypothetical protein [Deltaproteobacteria bacterium]